MECRAAVGAHHNVSARRCKEAGFFGSVLQLLVLGGFCPSPRLIQGQGQHRSLRTVLSAAPVTTVGGMLVHGTRLATAPAGLVPGFPDLRVPAACVAETYGY
jgi:hypothetical protein